MKLKKLSGVQVIILCAFVAFFTYLFYDSITSIVNFIAPYFETIMLAGIISMTASLSIVMMIVFKVEIKQAIQKAIIKLKAKYSLKK